jgi:hypothetical protein
MERQGVRTLAAFAATVVVSAGGCAVGASLPASADPDVPSTSVASDPPESCPNFVDVVETGPEPTDMSENGPIPQAQNRLRNDIDAAIAYGAAHPDEFGSVRFENAPRVRIVIGFTDHVDVHCAALRALLEFPEEFEIIRQPRTSNDIEQIQQEISVLAGPRMRYSGIGAGTIDVGLRADGEPIAEQIRARYGDLVTIQVGLQAYPPGRAPAPDCAARSGPIVVGSPFAATLRLETSSVRSGEDFKATALVTNRGASPVEFESGDPMTAFIYRRGTDEIVGAYDGGIGGVGLGATLAPGESIAVSVVGGTASCLADLGYALPPGEYDVRAAIDQYEHPPQGGVIVRYLLSAPAPLTVTP